MGGLKQSRLSHCMELGFWLTLWLPSLLRAFKTVASDGFAAVIVTSCSTNNNITPTIFKMLPAISNTGGIVPRGRLGQLIELSLAHHLSPTYRMNGKEQKKKKKKIQMANTTQHTKHRLKRARNTSLSCHLSRPPARLHTSQTFSNIATSRRQRQKAKGTHAHRQCAVDSHAKTKTAFKAKARAYPLLLLPTRSYPEKSHRKKAHRAPDTYRYGPRRCGNKHFDNHFDSRKEDSP